MFNNERINKLEERLRDTKQEVRYLREDVNILRNGMLGIKDLAEACKHQINKEMDVRKSLEHQILNLDHRVETQRKFLDALLDFLIEQAKRSNK